MLNKKHILHSKLIEEIDKLTTSYDRNSNIYQINKFHNNLRVLFYTNVLNSFQNINFYMKTYMRYWKAITLMTQPLWYYYCWERSFGEIPSSCSISVLWTEEIHISPEVDDLVISTVYTPFLFLFIFIPVMFSFFIYILFFLYPGQNYRQKKEKNQNNATKSLHDTV